MAKADDRSDLEKDLFEEISHGKVSKVKEIVSSGKVRVDCLEEHGMTPLQNAAFKGNKELCELLLAHGADVNSNEHENGYTTLMFAALAGSIECCRVLLEAGAKTSSINSVGRTATQMAAFVGQHSCVSLINNFFTKEDLDYYTKPQGFEKEGKLPSHLAGPLHKMILQSNLNPVKIALYMIKSKELLENASKVARVLDVICEKEFKKNEVNEVLSVKMHYLASVVRACHVWNVEKLDGMDGFVKSLLKGRETDGFQLAMEKFIREIIREYPYHESQLLQQMVRNIAPVKPGDDPSALCILTQGINGSHGFKDENVCATCGDQNSEKKCSACKMVNYCCQNCQKLHWFTHKKVCKTFAELYKKQKEMEEKMKQLELEREKQKLESEKESKDEKDTTEDEKEPNKEEEIKQETGEGSDELKEVKDISGDVLKVEDVDLKDQESGDDQERDSNDKKEVISPES
ncbi:ankyrin repeat and MYND domain-containing protein 2-like [Saccoglossus kowalevskii]|uniref:Ankyrin repeat and MYND domain-containing protein 2-like n=1 Tax=Saccoglossus kowalevskii TaxID=10224 RepID=A0ABM0GVB5_SACKO|nr:PREDICTED: ankyrin repeat and MYND domain-containing protein 2-like [Saccoglossus kowalevskii]